MPRDEDFWGDPQETLQRDDSPPDEKDVLDSDLVRNSLRLPKERPDRRIINVFRDRTAYLNPTVTVLTALVLGGRWRWSSAFGCWRVRGKHGGMLGSPAWKWLRRINRLEVAFWESRPGRFIRSRYRREEW